MAKPPMWAQELLDLAQAKDTKLTIRMGRDKQWDTEGGEWDSSHAKAILFDDPVSFSLSSQDDVKRFREYLENL